MFSHGQACHRPQRGITYAGFIHHVCSGYRHDARTPTRHEGSPGPEETRPWPLASAWIERRESARHLGGEIGRRYRKLELQRLADEMARKVLSSENIRCRRSMKNVTWVARAAAPNSSGPQESWITRPPPWLRRCERAAPGHQNRAEQFVPISY